MRKICASPNAAPIAALIACAEASEWPMGFSSTMRLFWSTSPAVASEAAMSSNRSGAVAM